MPKLNIDEFDETPHIGDKVKVVGKIKSIDEDSGEVEVSYDSVTIVNKNKKDKSDNNDESDYSDNLDNEEMPESQSLDAALSRAFPNTQ
jgi:hypothetical protein